MPTALRARASVIVCHESADKDGRKVAPLSRVAVGGSATACPCVLCRSCSVLIKTELPVTDCTWRIHRRQSAVRENSRPWGKKEARTLEGSNYATRPLIAAPALRMEWTALHDVEAGKPPSSSCLPPHTPYNTRSYNYISLGEIMTRQPSSFACTSEVVMPIGTALFRFSPFRLRIVTDLTLSLSPPSCHRE
ncbi:hypothetical protein MRX96_059607 [Rhipicephalus microplus]